jgi:CBS domain containing-hemolysin-like protein
MTQIFLIGLAVLLVLLNGFFVAAEFGLVKLRQTRVEAMKGAYGIRGEILLKVHHHLDTYLSACQLGITLASLGLGWVGEPAFARLLAPSLHNLGIMSPTTVSAISFALAFFIITFMHIVLGELAPKSLAIRQPQSISLWTALPLYCFYWLMYPFIWILNKSANLTLRLLGRGGKQDDENTHYSTEELKLILHGSHLHGELEKEEIEILDNVLDFADLKVADIMRPYDEMVALAINDPLADNLKKMSNYRYSRYPLYEEDPKLTIGLVHVKDIFLAMHTSTLESLHQLMRPILSVSTDLPALELFQQFRAGLSHFAVVKHSSGAVVGFVTLENVLSDLLGQIRDEFNKPSQTWLRTREGILLMKGNTPLYELEKTLDIELPPTEANTISGLLLGKLERMPKINERVHFEAFDIVVLKIKGPQILLVKVYPKLGYTA